MICTCDPSTSFSNRFCRSSFTWRFVRGKECIKSRSDWIFLSSRIVFLHSNHVDFHDLSLNDRDDLILSIFMSKHISASKQLLFNDTKSIRFPCMTQAFACDYNSASLESNPNTKLMNANAEWREVYFFLWVASQGQIMLELNVIFWNGSRSIRVCHLLLFS